MSAERVLERALIQLEFNLLEEGETSLRGAIELAEIEQDVVTLTSAMCCLGDLMFSLNRDREAQAWLTRVLEHEGNEQYRDSLKDEFEMAREFLFEMGNLPPSR